MSSGSLTKKTSTPRVLLFLFVGLWIISARNSILWYVETIGLRLQVIGFQAPTRVAVCITGASRTFYHPIVYKGIKRKLIDPLKEGNNYHVDVIFTMKLELNNTKERPDSNLQPKMKLTKEYLRDLMKKFEPRLINEVSEKDDINPEECECKMNLTSKLVGKPEHCENTRYNSAHVPLSLHTYSHCHKQILEYEERVRRKYDYVYITRPDLKFLDRITLPYEMRSNTVYTGRAVNITVEGFQQWWEEKYSKYDRYYGTFQPVNDMVLAGSRDAMEIAMQAEQAINDCDLYDVYGVLNPETQLGYWLMSHDVKIKAMPWFYAILRFYVGMECHTLTTPEITFKGKKINPYQACYNYNARYIRTRV